MKSLFVMLFLSIVYILKGEIVLSEIMFNPAGSEYSDEFVEIFNRGNVSICLEGWRIGDGISDDCIAVVDSGFWLEPGQYGLIMDSDYFLKSNSYQGLVAESALILTIDGSTLGSGGLSNSTAESIVLTDAQDQIMDRYTYSIPNVSGYSDERIDMLVDGDSNNWADSRVLNGTPGFKNSISKVDFDLAVISLCQDSIQTDDSFILFQTEIYNSGRFDVTDFLIYFFHDTNSDSVQQKDEIFSIISNLTLPAGESFELSGEWFDPPFGNHTIGVYADYDRDEEIYNNQKLIQLDIPFPVGGVIINEVMANPIPGCPEWIELFVPNIENICLDRWFIFDGEGNQSDCLSGSSDLFSSSQYYIISESASIQNQFYDIQVPVLVPEHFPNLNNVGDSVFLVDPAGHCIDNMTYTQDQVRDSGVSLERIRDAGLSLDRNNWLPSTNPQGATPGSINSVNVDSMVSKISLTVSPDPFSPDGDGFDDQVYINYRIPTELARVRLMFFDVRGRCIRTMLNGDLSGSRRTLAWNGLDESGMPARMGIYILYFEVIDDRNGKIWQEKRRVVLARAL